MPDLTPEQRARQQIDAMLTASSWVVQNKFRAAIGKLQTIWNEMPEDWMGSIAFGIQRKSVISPFHPFGEVIVGGNSFLFRVFRVFRV